MGAYSYVFCLYIFPLATQSRPDATDGSEVTGIPLGKWYWSEISSFHFLIITLVAKKPHFVEDNVDYK